MKQIRISLAAVACFVGLVSLAGCTTPPVVVPVQKSEVAEALERSLARVHQMPDHTTSMDAKAKDATLAGGSITIHSYQNEAAKLLSRVAAARGMKFLVRGPEPRLPLFVNIDVENVSFEEFLATVGHQFGQRADIVLSNDTIEIRYRGL